MYTGDMIEISKSIIQKDTKYLVLKRASHSKSFPNTWDFAWGKDEPWETPEQSVIRETREETGYKIQPWKEIDTKRYTDKTYDLLFHYFTPNMVEWDIILSDAHSEFLWTTAEKIKHLDLHPSVKLFFWWK